LKNLAGIKNKKTKAIAKILLNNDNSPSAAKPDAIPKNRKSYMCNRKTLQTQ
jgi:hypothetical protein